MHKILGIRVSHSAIGWAQIEVGSDRTPQFVSMGEIANVPDTALVFKELVDYVQMNWPDFDALIVRETVLSGEDRAAPVERINGFLDFAFAAWEKHLENLSTSSVKMLLTGSAQTRQQAINEKVGSYLGYPVTPKTEWFYTHSLAAAAVALAHLIQQGFIDPF